MLQNWTHNFVVASAILAFLILSVANGDDQVQFGFNAGHSKAGICFLEVPTLDLLSAEAKRLPIPLGNGSNPRLSRIEVCCSGWTRKPHNHYECEPICENGCINGNCTAPNVCTCKRGHVKNLQDACIPTCPLGCLNGVCTVRGICSCDAGFESSRDGKYCVPVCRHGCGIGGECIGNDRCHCTRGHILNTNTNKCEYHCEGGCTGGTCTGPNQCTCREGFQKKGNVCVASCQGGCRNGECVGLNLCRCQRGWNLDRTGTVCEAHCTEPCLNGDCVAPNVCACKNGYAKDYRNPSGNRCVADCPGGCPNGQCTAPNFCICDPGFVKERKGSNNCIRKF